MQRLIVQLICRIKSTDGQEKMMKGGNYKFLIKGEKKKRRNRKRKREKERGKKRRKKERSIKKTVQGTSNAELSNFDGFTKFKIY